MVLSTEKVPALFNISMSYSSGAFADVYAAMFQLRTSWRLPALTVPLVGAFGTPTGIAVAVALSV